MTKSVFKPAPGALATWPGSSCARSCVRTPASGASLAFCKSPAGDVERAMQPGNGLVDPEVVMRLAELRIDLLCHSLTACLRVRGASISPFPRGCVSLLYYILDYKYIIYLGT